MASKDHDDNLDLRDVLLYAPLGMVYEYKRVMPQLVRKGRSQMQLGLFLGRMAASKGSAGAERAAADALTTMATIAARGITEFGQAVGLAPPEDDAPPVVVAEQDASDVTAELPPPPKANTAPEAKKSPAKKPTAKKKPAAKKRASDSGSALRLPIAGYDDLTAREIVALLDDLTAAQRTRLRKHESANRNRKTVLAKLDRLDK